MPKSVEDKVNHPSSTNQTISQSSSLSSPSSLAILTNEQVFELLPSSNHGRKADPRMQKALLARLKYPSLTLLEALLIGGFEFHDEDGGTFDKDNIDLLQRKNQLSRRIRVHKRNLEGIKKKPDNTPSGKTKTTPLGLDPVKTVPRCQNRSKKSKRKRPPPECDLVNPLTKETNSSNDNSSLCKKQSEGNEEGTCTTNAAAESGTFAQTHHDGTHSSYPILESINQSMYNMAGGTRYGGHLNYSHNQSQMAQGYHYQHTDNSNVPIQQAAPADYGGSNPVFPFQQNNMMVPAARTNYIENNPIFPFQQNNRMISASPADNIGNNPRFLFQQNNTTSSAAPTNHVRSNPIFPFQQNNTISSAAPTNHLGSNSSFPFHQNSSPFQQNNTLASAAPTNHLGSNSSFPFHQHSMATLSPTQRTYNIGSTNFPLAHGDFATEFAEAQRRNDAIFPLTIDNSLMPNLAALNGQGTNLNFCQTSSQAETSGAPVRQEEVILLHQQEDRLPQQISYHIPNYQAGMVNNITVSNYSNNLRTMEDIASDPRMNDAVDSILNQRVFSDSE